MKFGAENDAGVFYARKGYYQGKEVTVTHRDGAMVWLEDYPIGKNPIEYGCWVSNESVSYQGETKENKKNEVNKRGSKQVNKKTGRQQVKRGNRGEKPLHV